MQDTSRLEHVALAVEDPQAVAALCKKLLGLSLYKAETVADQGVRTHFIAAGAAKLELLEALGSESPVARFLERHGEGLHHLAFEVDDLQAAMERVRALGFTPLSDTPQPGADGKQIFFLHPRDTHGVLIEFCQSVPAPLEATRVSYRASHLAAHVLGSDAQPPLVVLHGAAGCTQLETADLARRLEPHFHVIALDLSGHGASGPAPAPFSLDLFAENVCAVLDHFGYASAHLFGFSLGGAVALQVAARYPEHVRRLAVHGTTLYWSTAQADALMARLDASRGSGQQHAHADWNALLGQTKTFVRALAERPEEEAMLHRVQAPVLVSAASGDDLFPPETPLRLHRQLSGSQLALLPGTQHALRAVDLDVLTALLLPFFRSERRDVS